MVKEDGFKLAGDPTDEYCFPGVLDLRNCPLQGAGNGAQVRGLVVSFCTDKIFKRYGGGIYKTHKKRIKG